MTKDEYTAAVKDRFERFGTVALSALAQIMLMGGSLEEATATLGAMAAQTARIANVPKSEFLEAQGAAYDDTSREKEAAASLELAFPGCTYPVREKPS